jgi:phospholipid transport system substrate-binding protein
MHLAPSTRGLLAAGLAGICLLLARTPVFAGPATDRLREFFGQVNVVLNDPAVRSQPLEKVARVKRLVTDIADVRGAASEALEQHWDARTPAERDEFTWLFSELLERGLVARLAGTVSPVNGMVMSWRSETRVGDEAKVMTVVEARDGRKVNVEYRMIERRGRWLVRDVIVDGVSTIENYRSQFKRVLRHGSYATLVAQLRAKLGEETLMFAQTTPPPPAPAGKPAETVAARPAAPRVTPSRVASAPGKAAPSAAVPVVASAIKPASSITTTLKSTPTVKTIPSAAVVAPSVVAKSTDAPVTKTIAASATKPASSPTSSSASSPVTSSRSSVPAANVVSSVMPVVSYVTVVPATKPRAKVDGSAPTADVLSPVGVAEITAHLLPSVLLIMLGFAGVSGVVVLRRRASANALVLHRLRDGDERLVLLHPVARVAKVRERGRKRRVVPATRNPARHVDNAHGA